MKSDNVALPAMYDWDWVNCPDKAPVIEELITWIPVLLERPETLKAYKFEELHPAADVLRSVGVEAIAPLEKRLLDNPDSEHSELMLRLLQRLNQRFNDYQNVRLRALKARTNSVRLKTVIDQVDKLTWCSGLPVTDEEEIVVPLSVSPTPTPK